MKACTWGVVCVMGEYKAVQLCPRRGECAWREDRKSAKVCASMSQRYLPVRCNRTYLQAGYPGGKPSTPSGESTRTEEGRRGTAKVKQCAWGRSLPMRLEAWFIVGELSRRVKGASKCQFQNKSQSAKKPADNDRPAETRVGPGQDVPQLGCCLRQRPLAAPDGHGMSCPRSPLPHCAEQGKPTLQAEDRGLAAEVTRRAFGV
ncbi:hypothetical protein NDU88_001960 [Pleurodeles waltl]|uniref:Uncharacterized protein n=1 Tax=Pleurodeles waltl TaxID=8319 RepID=A0AAV7Q7G6_PLEWA|nr:hypothetical protein NDU88_001960 [Pleurodeles waltl]